MGIVHYHTMWWVRNLMLPGSLGQAPQYSWSMFDHLEVRRPDHIEHTAACHYYQGWSNPRLPLRKFIHHIMGQDLQNMKLWFHHWSLPHIQCPARSQDLNSHNIARHQGWENRHQEYMFGIWCCLRLIIVGSSQHLEDNIFQTHSSV